MDQLRRDVRIALRGLRRSPTFTATATLLLAVAIGIAGAMWSVLDAVILPSPASPGRKPDRAPARTRSRRH